MRIGDGCGWAEALAGNMKTCFHSHTVAPKPCFLSALMYKEKVTLQNLYKDLRQVLNEANKIVNHVTSRQLNP